MARPEGRTAWRPRSPRPSLRSGRATFVLGLAFFVLGLQFCFPRVLGWLGLGTIPFVELAVCLPAIVLGIQSWLRGRSFASSWPVAVCALLVWVSLFYAEQTQSKRGLYYATALTATLPMAALIDGCGGWAFCARAFVVGSTAATLIVAWIQLGVERGWANLANVRFGLYYVRWRGEYLTNPNEVGFQLATAAVLAFLLYLRGGAAGLAPVHGDCPDFRGESRENGTVPFRPPRPGRLGLGWTAILVAGCMLTGSRGAVIACFAGMGMLAVWGTRDLQLGRVKDLMFAITLGMSLLLVLALSTSRAPWEGLKARFLSDNTVASLGGRTEIWQNVFRTLGSNCKYLLFGAGTGMAPQALGQFDPGAVDDGHGRPHRSCHNLFLDWLLSYGLVGLAAGSFLTLAIAHRAVQLDRRDAAVDRKAILATLVLLGSTGVLYQHGCWLATGSLVLAMLSDPPLVACFPGANSDAPSRVSVRPGPHGPGSPRLCKISATFAWTRLQRRER